MNNIVIFSFINVGILLTIGSGNSTESHQTRAFAYAWCDGFEPFFFDAYGLALWRHDELVFGVGFSFGSRFFSLFFSGGFAFGLCELYVK
jgi:hypothetical protein